MNDAMGMLVRQWLGYTMNDAMVGCLRIRTLNCVLFKMWTIRCWDFWKTKIIWLLFWKDMLCGYVFWKKVFFVVENKTKVDAKNYVWKKKCWLWNYLGEKILTLKLFWKNKFLILKMCFEKKCWLWKFDENKCWTLKIFGGNYFGKKKFDSKIISEK